MSSHRQSGTLTPYRYLWKELTLTIGTAEHVVEELTSKECNVNRCLESVSQIRRSLNSMFHSVEWIVNNGVCECSYGPNSDSGERVQRAGRRRRNPPRTPDGSPTHSDPLDRVQAQFRNRNSPSFSRQPVSNAVVINSPPARERSPGQHTRNSTNGHSANGSQSPETPMAVPVRSGIGGRRSSYSPVSPSSDFGSPSQFVSRHTAARPYPHSRRSSFNNRFYTVQNSRNYHNNRNDSTFSRHTPMRRDRSVRPRKSRSKYEHRQHKRRSARRSRSRSHYDTTARHRSSRRHSRSRMSRERSTKRRRSTSRREYVYNSPAPVTNPFRPPSPPQEISSDDEPVESQRTAPSEIFQSVPENNSSSLTPRQSENQDQNNAELVICNGPPGDDEFIPPAQIPNEQIMEISPREPMPYYPQQYSQINYQGNFFFYSKYPMGPRGVMPPRHMPPPHDGLLYHQRPFRPPRPMYFPKYC